MSSLRETRRKSSERGSMDWAAFGGVCREPNSKPSQADSSSVPCPQKKPPENRPKRKMRPVREGNRKDLVTGRTRDLQKLESVS